MTQKPPHLHPLLSRISRLPGRFAAARKFGTKRMLDVVDTDTGTAPRRTAVAKDMTGHLAEAAAQCKSWKNWLESKESGRSAMLLSLAAVGLFRNADLLADDARRYGRVLDETEDWAEAMQYSDKRRSLRQPVPALASYGVEAGPETQSVARTSFDITHLSKRQRKRLARDLARLAGQFIQASSRLRTDLTVQRPPSLHSLHVVQTEIEELAGFIRRTETALRQTYDVRERKAS